MSGHLCLSGIPSETLERFLTLELPTCSSYIYIGITVINTLLTSTHSAYMEYIENRSQTGDYESGLSRIT